MIEYIRDSATRISVKKNGVQVGYIKDSCCYTLIKSDNMRNAVRVDYFVGQGGLLANNYKTKTLSEFKSEPKGFKNHHEYIANYESKLISGEIIGEYDLALKEIYKRFDENPLYKRLADSGAVVLGVSDIINGKYITNLESKKFKVLVENKANKRTVAIYATIETYAKDIEPFLDTDKFTIK